MSDTPTFLTELFEFERCDECGGDAEHHEQLGGPFGLPFALCKHEPSDDGTPHPIVQAYLEAEEAAA